MQSKGSQFNILQIELGGKADEAVTYLIVKEPDWSLLAKDK